MNFLISECKACKSPHIEYRLFNKWSINREFLYGISFGFGLTLTGFIVYKCYKFNNSLCTSINEINALKNCLNHAIKDLSQLGK
jgi:hypothetical protein